MPTTHASNISLIADLEPPPLHIPTSKPNAYIQDLSAILPLVPTANAIQPAISAVPPSGVTGPMALKR